MDKILTVHAVWGFGQGFDGYVYIIIRMLENNPKIMTRTETNMITKKNKYRNFTRSTFVRNDKTTDLLRSPFVYGGNNCTLRGKHKTETDRLTRSGLKTVYYK